MTRFQIPLVLAAAAVATSVAGAAAPFFCGGVSGGGYTSPTGTYTETPAHCVSSFHPISIGFIAVAGVGCALVIVRLDWAAVTSGVAGLVLALIASFTIEAAFGLAAGVLLITAGFKLRIENQRRSDQVRTQ